MIDNIRDSWQVGEASMFIEKAIEEYPSIELKFSNLIEDLISLVGSGSDIDVALDSLYEEMQNIIKDHTK